MFHQAADTPHSDEVMTVLTPAPPPGSLGLLIGREVVRPRGPSFETALAVAADQGAGEQGHAGDGQQLEQTLPGEEVVQGRHLGQHGARLHADEVVRQEACGRRGGGNMAPRRWNDV